MARTAIKIGPADNGRRMTLKDFEFAEVQEGHVCELSRGVVIVSDVPSIPHLTLVQRIRRQLAAYDLANPGKIHTIASGSECKLLVVGLESERHPDIAVYRKPPPALDNEAWRTWVPELVVEVVSPSSRKRDYEDKREEYLDLGIQEYWIVDGEEELIVVLRRVRGRWNEQTLRQPEKYGARVLPGFELDSAAVLSADR